MWPFGKKKKTEQEQQNTHQQRVQEFAAQFESEELDLVAVTGPEGLKTDRKEGDELLTVTIPLTAWMDEYDSVVHQTPALLTTLADERLRDYLRSRVYADCIIKVRARPGKDGQTFQLAGLPEPGFDAELKAILDKQVTPVTRTVEGVGELALNRRIGFMQTEVPWLETKIQLTLEAEPETCETLFDPAARLLACSAQWDGQARELTARTLLEQVNAQLEENGEESVDEAALRAALEPEALQLSEAGVSLWFGCELLYGQSICVTGDVEQGPVRAEIED